MVGFVMATRAWAGARGRISAGRRVSARAVMAGNKFVCGGTSRREILGGPRARFGFVAVIVRGREFSDRTAFLKGRLTVKNGDRSFGAFEASGGGDLAALDSVNSFTNAKAQ